MQANYTTEYFHKAMKEAQRLCAELCKMYGWNANVICCHHEAYTRGYGGGHSDIVDWLKSANKAEGVNTYTMDWFRREVQKLLDNESEDDDMTDERVREIIKEEKSKEIIHFWQDLPSWSKQTVLQMYKLGVFNGASPSDLNLTPSDIKALCYVARSIGANTLPKLTDEEIKKVFG